MKVKLLVTLFVAAGLAIVPVAGASDIEQGQVGGPGAGGPVLIPNELEGHEFIGGPGAAGPVMASDILGYEPAGGPGAGGPVLTNAPADVTGGLDWTTIGLGVAFALGVALIVVGLGLRRRRGTVAQPQH
jgi:hypothetical protein